MPRTAPSWRKQFDTALPVAKRAGGSSITAAEEKPAKDRPTPAPVSSVAGRNSEAYADSGPNPTANSTHPSANTTPPGTAATRGPNRSITRPANADDSAAISGPGVTATPADSVDHPHTPVRNRM